ncbi:MAG: metallophosphoesterase family protein [Phycisphaerales bacterium]|nr:metallophosphoesterase family protein [Phycisphaerales bacterium]
MSERIVIISDTHLGRATAAARSADALRPLWADTDHLVINGDVAEVHHHRHMIAAAREVLRLHDLCEIDGVRVTILSGNHDPYISDIRHLRLAAGQVFVTHGDVMHPAVAPWSPAAPRIRRAYDEALARLEPGTRQDLELALELSQVASHAEWTELEHQAARSSMLGMFLRPWKLVEVLRYWRRLPHLANAFVAKHAPEARHIVLGHSHRPGLWTIGTRTVINTGSFGFPGHPRAVIIENDRLDVVRIRAVGDEYRLDPQPIRSFQLDPVTAPSTRPGSVRPSAAAISRPASTS